MKKIFYLLFIGTIAFGSCTKQDPIEVNITDSSNSSDSSSSPIIDANLIGHWKQTNVNNPNSSSYWNNGQIDLHFFADGTWNINGNNGVNSSNPAASGLYKIHSNNYIDLGVYASNEVLKYSINNGVLTFSSVPGRDAVWVIDYATSNTSPTIASSSQLNSNQNFSWLSKAEINNLVKQ
jgi:hypothetical protein